MTQPTVTPRLWRKVTQLAEGSSIASGFVGDGAVEEEPPSEPNTLIEWGGYLHNNRQSIMEVFMKMIEPMHYLWLRAFR